MPPAPPRVLGMSGLSPSPSTRMPSTWAGQAGRGTWSSIGRNAELPKGISSIVRSQPAARAARMAPLILRLADWMAAAISVQTSRWLGSTRNQASLESILGEHADCMGDEVLGHDAEIGVVVERAGGQAGIVEIVEMLVIEAVKQLRREFVGDLPAQSGLQRMGVEGDVGEAVPRLGGGQSIEEGAGAGEAVIHPGVAVGEAVIGVELPGAPAVAERGAEGDVVRSHRLGPGGVQRIDRSAGGRIRAGAGRVDVGDAAILRLPGDEAGQRSSGRDLVIQRGGGVPLGG